MSKKPLIALDTETTGLDLWHGCKPFFVSILNEQGKHLTWEWKVDPKTRNVIPVKKDLIEIQRYLDHYTIVLHNAKFDLRALRTVGLRLPNWNDVHDTCLASHVVESRASHKLKDLALRHLDISDDDQKELQKACVSARRIAQKKGWRIAKAQDPHWPAMKSTSKNKGQSGDSWWAADMWIPRQIAIEEGYPQDHPWRVLCETYCNTDTVRTLGLWYLFREELMEEGLYEQYNLRRKALKPTFGMEDRGISTTESKLKSTISLYRQEAKEKHDTCLKIANGKITNLNAPQQLQRLLYTDLKCPVVKETASSTEEKPSYASDAETLDEVYLLLPKGHPAKAFIRNLVGTRKRSKAADYLESYLLGSIPFSPEKKVKTVERWLSLHPNFNISGTDTTRLASYSPNAQNISKKEGIPTLPEISKREGFNLRRVFGPAPGREWYSADYSNIELRIFAYVSGDQRLIDAFESGESVHLVIAKELYPKEFSACEKAGTPFKDKYKSTYYQWVKNGNFSLIYGAGEKKANNTYRLPDAYKRIRKQFPLIDKFMRRMHHEATTLGYVTTLGGYRLQVPSNGPHKAVNYFVQGSAGWYMLLAMIRCDEYLSTLDDSYLNMTIHDELVFDLPANKNIRVKDKVAYAPKKHPIWECKRLMELSGNDLGIPVPVDVDYINDNWASETPLKLAL